MPKCSIIGCCSIKRKNQPQLSLHRFPKRDTLSKEWLNAIGEENINPRHKVWHVCSLHFEDSCFNRTLDVMRLRDGSVPTQFLRTNGEQRTVSSVLSETSSNIFGHPSTFIVSDRPSQLSTVHLEKIKRLTDKCLKQKQKIKNISRQFHRKVKKIDDLTDLIQDLQQRNCINTEQAILLEELAGPKDFLKRQINKCKGLPFQKKYCEEIRKFALTLHFLSPKAYNYIRQTYNTCLPHTRTLSKWYQNVNCEPGFTKEAFDVLRLKVQSSSFPVICSLVFDEMAIRKSLIWEPTRQKYYGRVDYGHNLDNDSAEEASQALVVLITCVNGSWKIPIGYFLINSLTGEQKGIIVNTALKLCDDVGVKIISITCDGPSANFSMFKFLSCDILKNQEVTYFERGNTLVHAFIDPCHTIKLIRNAFGELKVFYDSCGRKIDYYYLEQLHILQENKGLHLANKIKKAHIFFQKQKMKVKLATQLFSNSVADALEYCRSELKLQQFKDCEGTVNFINIINDVFDVLNSRSIRPPGFKKAMCPANIGLISALFEGANFYFNSLRLPTGELLINSRRKTGFIGIIINMKSAMGLYKYLIEETKMLRYIPLYKISQDHVELFFSAVRAKGGYNNNPNAIQFRAAYKKLLVRAEIRDDGVGNCIALEQVNILNCTSTNPILAINDLSERKSFLEIPEDHSDLYDAYMNCVLNEDVDVYTDRVLEYISGFVSKKLSRILKCEKCVSLLNGDPDSNSLIYIKSRGGLKYASPSVISIIKKSDKIIKTQLRIATKPELYYLYIFKFMCDLYNVDNFFFTDTDFEHNSSHKLLLIKSIIKTFLDIRYKYYGQKTSQKVSQRQFLNKLILFRNE